MCLDKPGTELSQQLTRSFYLSSHHIFIFWLIWFCSSCKFYFEFCTEKNSRFKKKGKYETLQIPLNILWSHSPTSLNKKKGKKKPNAFKLSPDLWLQRCLSCSQTRSPPTGTCAGVCEEQNPRPAGAEPASAELPAPPRSSAYQGRPSLQPEPSCQSHTCKQVQDNWAPLFKKGLLASV